ncbi:SAM-dependent DNA methyltransferase [Gordonia sp. HY442]|uniref:Eco57I restriction-modification methylase domain-containing protein n=1 Tax=Gordonia zhenghanii TaxID=2911516 RepID=UPI001F1CFA8C|nr:DNA methyltransferase [Gordonia zhenghanii]MCF8604010.1 SAM-dependent DNA methyltransferase [Gordonia zhenghanii]
MRKRTQKSTDVHIDWLSQVDVDGPFLSHPVLKDMWSSGVDRLGDTDDRLITFKQACAQWQRAFDHYEQQPRTFESKEAYDAVRRAWIGVVLNDLAEWNDLLSVSDVAVRSPGEQITVAATSALKGREDETAALLLVCEPTSGLRDAGLDGWAANEIDRLAMLLRKAQVEVGIVTDGQWWALVWAEEGKPTGSGVVNALTWAEEPLLRDAFITLINQRRFRASDTEQRLTRLFERSELEAEEITEALGTQVRRSVELLIQAFSEARLQAAKAGDPDPLTENPDDIYQAAVTVMMRVVFLLFAEERDMLPTEQLYWDSYAINGLLDDLRAQAAGGEEHLDENYDAWHRLLAVSQALHSGVNYDEMRMPAYGGSLLDPDRFPWLHTTDSRGLRLKVSDRVMLHVLESVQAVVVKGERRRISFREIDVEQIGYIYEGLLGYSCAQVTDGIILGLVGKDGAEPEIPLNTINDLYDEHGDVSKKFASALIAWFKKNQPAATGKSVAALAKLVDREPASEDRAELVRMLSPVAAGDRDLLDTLVSWGNLIRRDLRNIPLVIPVGGLVVIETPSRRNAGAHYTPRSLAEEVVLHALQPLVYEPGPLQTNDDSGWKLKSAAAILDLKVADIAAGSGAFLVAAARFLSERLVEAWISEGMLDEFASVDAEELRRRALREVIARSLYGADINPMAIEMCKLSLWLVSMDKTKPFSFVDDKIFCGNSLLGLTSIDQLCDLHIAPKLANKQQQLLIDVDMKISAATQLRMELASPVDDRDPMRSSRAKARLLEQFRQATAELRLIADGIVAAALPLGGKVGKQLDDAFTTLSWQLHEAYPVDGSVGDPTKFLERIALGLTPTVETDYERWQPLHWVVEAPDVMLKRGGFDAVIGNPPFLGGKKISAAMGSNFREFIVNTLADGRKGECDLVGYFFLRAGELIKSGSFGLISTESLAEGEARRVVLDPLLNSGINIVRSIKRRQWPTEASVHVSLVWGTKRGLAEPTALVWCDGELVAQINSSLEPVSRSSGVPFVLRENDGVSFMGSILSGKGFILDDHDHAALSAADPASMAVIRPLVGGSDINQNSRPGPRSWVIDFGEQSLDLVRSKYPGALARIESLVKPARDLVKKRQYRDRWWQFAERGKGLNEGLLKIEHVHVLVLTSDTLAAARVGSDAVFTNSLGVFLLDTFGDLALLNSSIHQVWAMRWGSSLDAATRYTTSDVFETWPRPKLTPDLHLLGREFEDIRSEILIRRGIGLTGVYKLVNDPKMDTAADILRLRELLVAIDRAVAGAYGWNDLGLTHGFHNYRQIERWTVSPADRVEILDRLLELNHERARAEGVDLPVQGSPNRQDTLFA